ncbi:hypothetical protein NMR92_001266 [Vibrio cholerae]|uniref:Uncharacterized protein n=1 Tax=Vibrio parahaemolyticus TaxID=670 RepID=A0A1B1LRS1_VIBPH|nr:MULTISPECIES: hypothetical protein [Vibrio]ANS55722.1 hypothetical protein [Vibrio parahaemolyticus]EJL6490366.1 hypothetical protein [Vibrio cholerae]EJL6642056.1 hypothetical protein [Vibrio cholerae]MCI9701805.1 hypothetical protein [Vibrio parahaemolyticus]MCR9815749.1 hypothetical protein [Vibrio parahaemolyticus]
MTTTRIFLDRKSKTIVHAIEEETLSFRDMQAGLEPEKHFTSISRVLLKQGSRQQGRGNGVFNELMNEGQFEEVTADSLIVKRQLSDTELDFVTGKLLAKLGMTGAKKFEDARAIIASLDVGESLIENTQSCTAQPQSEDEMNSTIRELILVEAKVVADEFDKEGLVDWRVRDSLIARFRLSVRRRLRNVEGHTFVTSAVNKCLDHFLTSQPA